MEIPENGALRSDTVVCWCVSYGSLGCRQTPFPADVYEARGDDDGADGTNNHQNHKEFAVVAALLPGREGAADGCAVVLDANLSRPRECTMNARKAPVHQTGHGRLKHVYVCQIHVEVPPAKPS